MEDREALARGYHRGLATSRPFAATRCKRKHRPPLTDPLNHAAPSHHSLTRRAKVYIIIFVSDSAHILYHVLIAGVQPRAGRCGLTNPEFRFSIYELIAK